MQETPDTTGTHVAEESNIEARLTSLGIRLPIAAKPVGAYVPAVRSGRWVFTSGQLPMTDGALASKGIVGKDVTVEEAYRAARVCCLNALAALQAELGNLDRVTRVVKVTGFVASAVDFTAQPQVINGASELLIEVFGDRGRHARSAVGVAVLPLNASVELELIAEVAS
ncbi:MAG: RidA family protein [Thermodesulfobacteriota bacterium]